MKAKAAAFAAALFELARAEGQIDKVDRDFCLVTETVGANLKLKDALTNPQLSVEKKQAIVGEIFAGRVSPTALGFLQLLVGMDKVEYIRLISEELTRLVQLEEKKIIAEVTTVIELGEAMKGKLAKRLSELTGKDVKIRSKVDESILGGIIVRMDGKLLDGSISSQLENLKNQLITGKARGER